MSLRWTPYPASKPQRGLRTQTDLFCRFSLGISKKVCYKVAVCENCQRQSCKAFTGLSIRAQIVGGGHPLKCKFYSWSEPPVSAAGVASCGTLTATCYATSEYRLESAVLEGGGSLWSKISCRRGHPPPTICVRIDRPVNALQLYCWQFSYKQTLQHTFFERSPFFIRKRKNSRLWGPLWVAWGQRRLFIVGSLESSYWAPVSHKWTFFR